MSTIDPFLQHLFLMEIKHQCEFATKAYDDILAALGSHDADRVWASLQLFLISAANISKIFWPIGSHYDQTGATLRNLLAVDDISPLSSRDARNHFEQFDERLHKWFLESAHHNIMDMSIGDPSRNTGSIDYMRYFNTKTFAFRFRREEYKVEPLYKAINELLTNTNNELSKPPTTPSSP